MLQGTCPPLDFALNCQQTALAGSLTHSLTRPPTRSPTRSLTHSPTHPPTHPPTHSLSHLPPTHSLTHSLTHPLAHSPIGKASSAPLLARTPVHYISLPPLPLLDTVLAEKSPGMAHYSWDIVQAVFWQEFHESRGDMQIRLSSWSRHTALGHVRELSFVSPIKVSSQHPNLLSLHRLQL